MGGRWRVRAILNWLTLGTPLGLLISALAGCSASAGERGLYLATGYGWRVPTGAAFTVGNVVLLRHERLLERPRLLRHEDRHATQWAWCLGIIGFPILYGAATLWSLLRTGTFYRRNLFEVRAGLQDGGYRAS